MDVSIGSPSMIGGARSAVTDELGSYRFTLLTPGVYRVTFTLMGFKTVNFDGVAVPVGTTMTVNGTMELAALAQEVTVTGAASAVDLEAAKVGVNWTAQQFENLPYGRHSVGLAAMIPGLYATTYDVGGNTKGGPTGTNARTYGRVGGNTAYVDGAVADGYFGEYGSYEESQISTAAKGAEAMNPGTIMNFIVKSGGNTFHGSFYGDWQDGSFQSSNVTQKLLDRGFNATGNKYTRYNDITTDIGGPILRDKLWFYGSYGDTYIGLFVPGFIWEKTGEPAVFQTILHSPTLKMTYQLTPSMKLESVAHWQQKRAPYRTGDQFTPAEATQNQTYLGGIGPTLTWTYIIGSRMTTDVRVQRTSYWWPDTTNTEDVRRFDLTSTSNRGAYKRTNQGPIRWQSNGNWSWFTDIGGKNNELKTGYMTFWDKLTVDDIGHPNQQIYRYRSLPGETNYFLHPDSVQVFDYPLFRADVEQYNAWFITDKITWNRNLTLNVGVRYDRFSSYLPEQGNPGTGPFALQKVYPERHDFPVYQVWAPRLSMVYDLTGEGKVALKASYGRYSGGNVGSSKFNPGPFSGDVNPNSTTTWLYSNWDGSIPYVPRPQDLASVTGGRGNRQLDPNLKPPLMDEFTAGVELGLRPNYTLRFNSVYKKDFAKSKILDLALPFSAWTDVRTAVDPGRDNIVGTADDGIMRAWSVPNTYPTFRDIIQLTTNTESGEGVDRFYAYEATFNKQFSKGWSLMAGYTADLSKRRNVAPQNPNEVAYNWISPASATSPNPGVVEYPAWSSSVKINGQYTLPWGLMYAATYQVQQGEYYGRFAQMRNALNTLVTIQVEGQMGRYDWVKLWDSRLSKTFHLSSRHSIEAMVDVFNMLNSSVVLTQFVTNGPNFLKPLSSGSGATVAIPIIPPRIMRLGMRYRF